MVLLMFILYHDFIIFIYFAFLVEIIADEQSTDSHAHFLVCPLDALRPAMTF